MDDLQNNLVKKKESLIRQKKSLTHPEISKLVYNEMMVNFILTRLSISSGVDLKTDLKMVLTPMASDETNKDTNDLDIICPMPFGLKPVITTYQRNFRYIEQCLSFLWSPFLLTLLLYTHAVLKRSFWLSIS
jgi:hypothetical protein